MEQKTTLRIAAVGDIHVNVKSQGLFQPIFASVANEADVLVLCGDLTDYGLPEEAQVLAGELRALRNVPVLAVLGNHDYESSRQEDVRQILSDAGVIMLDGTAHEIDGVGFAGAKGFAGGFGRRALGPWGEPVIKQFVQEAIDEALRLESALARLRTDQKVVVLHYSPIHATVVGEPEEIIPFLGSSRLEEAAERYRANVIFHGHAHRGTFEGRTKGSIPVFNVAMPLLKQVRPDSMPYFLYEVACATEPALS